MNGSGGGNGRKDEQSGWRPSDWVVKREEEEPWPEAVNGKELLEEIARNMEKEQQEAEAKRASEKDQFGQKWEEQKGEGGVKPDNPSRLGT